MDVALDFLNEPIQELDNKKVEEYVNNLADTQIVTSQQEQINEASELFVTKQQNQNLLLSGIDEVPQVSIAKSQNQNAPEVQIITAKSQKSSRRGSQVDPQESLSSSKPMQLSINVPRVQPAKPVESVLSESEIKPTHIEGDYNTVKGEINPEENQIIDKLEEVIKPIEGNMLESESNLEQQIIGMDEFINDVKKIEIQSFYKCPIVTEVIKVDSEPVSPFQFKPISKSPDFHPRPQPRMVEFKSIEPIQIKQSINQPIEQNGDFTQQDKQTIQQAFESNNSNILQQKIAALNSSTQKFQNNSQNNSFTKFNKSQCQFSKIENSSHLLLNVSNINNQSVPLQRTVFKTESNQNDLKNKLNQQIEEMKTRNAIYKQKGIKVETEKDIQILQEFALKIK
ncbi:Hypothetical_protein [Hexamita inflata]|uniref:Hypothetical_protein n=1 Tax=Hexamita inflata TaxID=28002 RepID=A0AA86RHG7_9EUKA|nr:Hypothetical protein HINF_LOCUS9847 [Hexamita inflata]CAI9978106.1 Hypothetical protein HINF_LOCUS65751 [Hexamita inflata]